jgi:protochlorophyllide reductase
MMARDGRIVVTASSVHDPESPGGAQGVPATLGTLDGLRLQGKDCEMLDGNPFNADKAYKDSKVRTHYCTVLGSTVQSLIDFAFHLNCQLCNVLFTRELQRRLSESTATKGISVNCFSPGLIVGTGLFRDQNPFFIKLFDFAATDLFKVGETPEWGGASLAYMTTVSSKGLFYNSAPGSSKFGSAAFGREFVPMPISKEAQDDAKAALLWELSSKVLGIAA